MSGAQRKRNVFVPGLYDDPAPGEARMAVRAVVGMDVEWDRDTDQFIMLLRGEDKSVETISIPGAVFGRHGRKIWKAVAERDAARGGGTVSPIGKRGKH